MEPGLLVLLDRVLTTSYGRAIVGTALILDNSLEVGFVFSARCLSSFGIC